MNKILYKRFEDCIPVRGYVRSLLCDLTRRRHHFLPNDLTDILQKNIINKDEYASTENFDDYFDFLIENEFIFETTENELELYPPMSLEWDYASKISNAVLEIGQEEKYDVCNVLSQIMNLGCRFFTIIFDYTANIDELTKIVETFEYSSVYTVEFICKHNPRIEKEQLHDFLQKYNRISYIAFYDADQNLVEETEGMRSNIVYSKETINHSKCLVNPAYFTNNVSFFTESQKHNTFLNRKLSINKNGDILNYLGYKNTFGNVNIQDIENIISTPEFQKLWFVCKEQVDVCKDCEFRHICIDSREPLQRSDGSWYFQQECNYNPYICKWNYEEGFMPLNACGVYSTSKGFEIDVEKIAKINDRLWSD